MSELQARGELAQSIWLQNPVFKHLLGLSPLIAVSTTLTKGIALALISLLVFLCTAVTLVLIRNPLRESWRFFYYLLIIACYTTIAERMVYFFFTPLHGALAIYLPLIACNFAMLLQLEYYAHAPSRLRPLTGIIRLGIGYLIAMIALAASREFMISGSLLSDWQLLAPNGITFPTVSNGPGGVFVFARTPAMALILLGLLAALANLITRQPPAAETKADVVPAERVRVTGKLRGITEKDN